MPVKNSNTVGLERRVDLASLFCMIGRHGPAVALAVIAMVSMVAGFIIYRTVRGKRRKATAGATSTDSDSRDAGAETLIPPDQEPEPSPEVLRITADSTVVKAEGCLDVEEDTALNIRHRRRTAEKKTPPHRQPKSDSVQDNKHSASVQQVAELHAEEEDKGAEIDVETDGTNGTMEEGENKVIQSHKEELKVLQEKGQEDDVPTEMELSNKEASQEEENLLDISKSTAANLEEPIVHIEDVPVPSICYFKEENLQGVTDFSNDYSNNHHFPEEEKKSGGEEAEEELVDDQLTSQQAGISSTVFVEVTKLQGQCHEVMLSFQQNADEDNVSDSTDINFNSHLLQLAEQNNESELACNQDSDVKEEVPTEDIASRDEESNPSSVVLDHTLLCLNHMIEPENADNGDSSSVANDAKAQISGIGEISSLSSDQQQLQSNINEDDISQALGVTSGAAPVTSEDGKLPVLQIPLPSFEQSEPTWSSSGLGGESGISSMTVSPDLPDVISEYEMPTENVALTVKDDAQFKEHTEAQNGLLDDEARSAMNEDLANVISRSYPSYFSQQTLGEQIDWANDSSLAANEDILGHEIEDRYYREMEQAIEQMAANVTSLTDELAVKTDMKADIKVVEINQKMERAEKEKEEEDYEKTEISIMEATMDNNEWITDGNYQVLPWMNQSVPPFAQNHTQLEPVSTEADHPGASVTDATCIDASLSLNDVKQAIPLSPVHENGKKVVAVQPMSQNVNVTFRIHYLTHSPHQKVAITGSQQELGNWKKFILLERAEDGNWATVVSLPAESIVEWKFVVMDKGEVCRWEECGNRLLDTGYGDDLLVHKWWGLL
uniref:Starch-binding domain-containing protein 1 n=1 Tax=Maylandia zebra TaxID=106582 RepID=A0A3P9CI70_9CICH|nr:starch-binding domain-containing protein 1 [Maylandia zebra]